MKYRTAKIIEIVLFLIFFSILNLFCTKIAQAKATPQEGELQKVILIDPGHGDFDSGAISRSGLLEKDVNLSISLKLRDELNKKGYLVLMTRETDKGLYRNEGSIRGKKYDDLNARCKMKNESNCDMFISIHQNFFKDGSCRGAQVWYSRCEDSKALAQIIMKNFKTDLDEKNHREEKPARNDYKILRCYYNIPSVIVECGFLTNYNDEKKLKDEKYQQKIAESLAKSVSEYFSTEASM
ncbi:N-acetylmuramoyl-L-alanine amidase CwlD [Clostridium omnivorum]|uniref:N-acetylmuramoyl-L-alanine amidase CwlD n=1 Tax=Clostridium omnivorum TaxID=1604902 RepID=A0ABQ5N6R4_9CLOT|nr:N-acetylmuramoyl-L-alanine amidase CwlD [Clostridium sp. E14]GLC30945.1 N-acetylmuramoyl-L-alanine amidase CwlD [Clostridium sp. E14]